MKGTLAMLLREAPTDQRETATTMRFFAEMATYRGFVGSEVDETWASLNRIHKEYMVLELARYSIAFTVVVLIVADVLAAGVGVVELALEGGFGCCAPLYEYRCSIENHKCRRDTGGKRKILVATRACDKKRKRRHTP